MSENDNSKKINEAFNQKKIIRSEEIFEDKKLAWIRERQIKSYKGGEAFKRLIEK